MTDIVTRSLQSAGIPTVKEPQNLSRNDGRRPDGVTIIPFKAGRCLVFDVTTRCTLAPTYTRVASLAPRAVANLADEQKVTKYEALRNTYLVRAVAFETMGPASDATVRLLKEIGARVAMVTGDRRSGEFLLQRLSLAVQRGNAASVIAAMPGAALQRPDPIIPHM